MVNMKDKLNQPVSINFTTGTVIKTIIILFLTYLTYLLRDLVIMILTSVVIASAVEPATRWFMRKRIPRPVAVITIYLSILVAVTGISTLVLPPLAEDVRNVIMTIPQYVQSVDQADLDKIPGLTMVFNQLSEQVTSGNLLGEVGNAARSATF